MKPSIYHGLWGSLGLLLCYCIVIGTDRPGTLIVPWILLFFLSLFKLLEAAIAYYENDEDN